MAKHGQLPILQDDDDKAGVWDGWKAEWRDVFILNGKGEIVDIYNLTSNDLGNKDNYQTMKDKLLAAREK